MLALMQPIRRLSHRLSRGGLGIELMSDSVIHLRLNELGAFAIFYDIVIVLIVTTNTTFQPNK